MDNMKFPLYCWLYLLWWCKFRIIKQNELGVPLILFAHVIWLAGDVSGSMRVPNVEKQQFMMAYKRRDGNLDVDETELRMMCRTTMISSVTRQKSCL